MLHRRFCFALLSAASAAASAGGFSAAPVSPFPTPEGVPLKPIAAAAAEVASTGAGYAVEQAAPTVETGPGAGVGDPLTDAELEAKIEDLKPTAPRITPDHIQNLIRDETYTRLEGTNTTVCRLQLANGFCVVGVNNGPVSAANFNQEIGCEYAYKAAVDKIWPLEGYLLQQRLYEQDEWAKVLTATRDVLARNAPPDGVSDHDTLVELFGLFDVPGKPIYPTAPPEGTTHVAKPVHVTAAKILDVGGHDIATNCAMLRLSDGRNYEAGAEMTARYWPLVGDYLVRQEDGYEYLNPAAVFERKYRAVGTAAPAPTHQERVVAEKAALDGKIEKLDAFFTGPIYAGLAEAEQSRLNQQRHAMSAYSAILGERIAAF